MTPVRVSISMSPQSVTAWVQSLSYPRVQPSRDPKSPYNQAKETLFKFIKQWIFTNISLLAFDGSGEDIEFMDFLEMVSSKCEPFWRDQTVGPWIQKTEFLSHILEEWEARRGRSDNISQPSQQTTFQSSVDLTTETKPCFLEKLPNEILSIIFHDVIQIWKESSFELVTLSKRLHPIILRELIRSPPVIYSWQDCYRFFRMKRQSPNVPISRLTIRLSAVSHFHTNSFLGLFKVIENSQSVTTLTLSDSNTSYDLSRNPHIYSEMNQRILALRNITELNLRSDLDLNVIFYLNAFDKLVRFTLFGRNTWYSEKGILGNNSGSTYDPQPGDPPAIFPKSLRHIHLHASSREADQGPMRVFFRTAFENSLPIPPLRTLHIHIGKDIKAYLYPILGALRASLEELFISGCGHNSCLTAETYSKVSQCQNLSCLELQNFKLSSTRPSESSLFDTNVKKLVLAKCIGDGIDIEYWIEVLTRYKGKLGNLVIDDRTFYVLKGSVFRDNWSGRREELGEILVASNIELDMKQTL